MEELFLYSLLYCAGYEECEKFQSALDRLFMSVPESELLLDLEQRECKDAMLHLYGRMAASDFDTAEFGKLLMNNLQSLYEESDIRKFCKSMYALWKLLPSQMQYEEPFYTLSYAGECLSHNDEKQCRELFVHAFDFYNS